MILVLALTFPVEVTEVPIATIALLIKVLSFREVAIAIGTFKMDCVLIAFE